MPTGSRRAVRVCLKGIAWDLFAPFGEIGPALYHGTRGKAGGYDWKHFQPSMLSTGFRRSALRNTHSPISRLDQSPWSRAFALLTRATSTAASAPASGMQAKHAPVPEASGFPG